MPPEKREVVQRRVHAGCYTHAGDIAGPSQAAHYKTPTRVSKRDAEVTDVRIATVIRHGRCRLRKRFTGCGWTDAALKARSSGVLGLELASVQQEAHPCGLDSLWI